MCSPWMNPCCRHLSVWVGWSAPWTHHSEGPIDLPPLGFLVSHVWFSPSSFLSHALVFHCISFGWFIASSLWRAGLLLWCMHSSCGLGLSSWGTWASLLRGMWNLSSPNKDWTWVPCIGRQILNHWTTRGIPIALLWWNLSSKRICLRKDEWGFMTLYITFWRYLFIYVLGLTGP